MRALLASPLGFLIGLSLGALGGGGSILAVPALVYAAGQDARHATATSLVLVGITSLIGLLPHWRAGRVRWLSGTIFGLAGIGGSLIGSRLNKLADPDVLLLAFSVLMIVAAFAMCRRAQCMTWLQKRTPDESCDVPRPAPTAPPTTASTLTIASTAPPAAAKRVDAVVVLKVVAAGSLVGLLTGFFGVGGGFVIVPSLVLALGFTMPEAVGTSLLVIAISAAVALSTRLQAGSIDWNVVVPFTIASLLGVWAGSRLASTRDPQFLQRWFVWLLLAVAAYTFTTSLLALV